MLDIRIDARFGSLVALVGLCTACKGGGEAKTGGTGDTALPTLALTSVSPDSGPVSGGTPVTLTGAGFTSSTLVTIGGLDCSALTVVSDAEIACTTPAGEPGEAQVVVVRPEDGATATGTFTYTTGGGGDDTGSATDDTGTDSGSGTEETGHGGDTSSGGDTGATASVDYCHLQWPCTMTASGGTSSEMVYVWVYQAGVTEGEGQGAGIEVEVGVGPDGSDPNGGGWTWAAATWNMDKDGLTPGDLANDEYAGTFTVPSVAGSYDYCGRVSIDGGASWTLCDLGGDGCGGLGSNDGYDPANAGQLTVE